MNAGAVASAVLVVTLAADTAAAATEPLIPHLGGPPPATRLYVDGKPFLILGGELGNSAAATVAWVRPLFPKLAAMNLNTVLVPVSWELVEPEEGKFSFEIVTGLVQEARRQRLRLVLLWFGSWKNGMSSYVPAWVKTNPQRFPRAERKGGRPVEALSAFSRANLDADCRAFAALMRHLRSIDQRQHTVVMVQVENEVAMIDEAADRSAAAGEAYRAAVPRELTDYLEAHRATLAPELARAWREAGARPVGTWAELFGKGPAGEEVFMAWHYARYVDAVTRAGKAEYPLPMFVNAALNRPGLLPGQYPSAGPLPHLIDVWKAGAPSVDLMAPDIYYGDFAAWCERFRRPGNPLFIPEARNDEASAVEAFYAAGQQAIGFSPFAIEKTAPELAANLGKAYRMLADLAPLLGPAPAPPAPPASAGVLLTKEAATAKLTVGGLALTVSHDYTFPWAAAARNDPVWPRGGALLVALSPDELLVAGSGVIVTFDARNDEQVGIERADEGRVERGRFITIRRLNGDETHQGRHLRIPMGEMGVQRVKLYRYR